MLEIKKPVFPKEHGLWAWVFLPLVTGAACADGNHYVMAPLLVCIFAGFMTLTPARIIFKNWKKGAAQDGNVLFWFIVYAMVAFFFTLFTVTINLKMLPFFGGLALCFAFAVRASAEGYQRSAVFEFGGMAAISLLLSLLGAFAVSGTLTAADGAVWLLVLLFMLDRSVQARRVARLGGFIPALAQQSKKHAGTLKTVFLQNIGLAALSPMLALVIAQKLGAPLAVAAAFVPGLLVTLYFWKKPPAQLRTLGFAELFLSILFAALFITQHSQ